MIPTPFGAKIEIFGGGSIRATLEIERMNQARKEKEKEEEKEKNMAEVAKELAIVWLNAVTLTNEQVAQAQAGETVSIKGDGYSISLGVFDNLPSETVLGYFQKANGLVTVVELEEPYKEERTYIFTCDGIGLAMDKTLIVDEDQVQILD